jgi:uncharacterized membrane protein YebE (DUF533 family)
VSVEALPASADAAAPATPPGLDASIACVLADKVLYAWLRNRYQLLFPFALDLRRLDADAGALAIDAMLVAAQADGTFDARERERIEAALALVAPGRPAGVLLDEGLASPKPLSVVLQGVRDVQGAALVYAASLMAIDPGRLVNRRYLGYLAARLQLSEELVDSLERRFRATA